MKVPSRFLNWLVMSYLILLQISSNEPSLSYISISHCLSENLNQFEVTLQWSQTPPRPLILQTLPPSLLDPLSWTQILYMSKKMPLLSILLDHNLSWTLSQVAHLHLVPVLPLDIKGRLNVFSALNYFSSSLKSWTIWIYPNLGKLLFKFFKNFRLQLEPLIESGFYSCMQRGLTKRLPASALIAIILTPVFLLL